MIMRVLFRRSFPVSFHVCEGREKKPGKRKSPGTEKEKKGERQRKEKKGSFHLSSRRREDTKVAHAPRSPFRKRGGREGRRQDSLPGTEIASLFLLEPSLAGYLEALFPPPSFFLSKSKTVPTVQCSTVYIHSPLLQERRI